MKGITVVTEDRKGLIAELSSQLEAGGVNILSINAREEDGTAYVALEVDKYDEALAVLRDGAYHAVPEEVLVIRIEDRPGGLAAISRLLADSDISIKGMTMLQRMNGWCAVAVNTNDNDRSRDILGPAVMDQA